MSKYIAITCLLSMMFMASPAHSSGFAAVVSPPRFEISVKPGETSRQVFEIMNDSTSNSSFRVRSSDWQMVKDASGEWIVDFFDDKAAPDGSTALEVGSCRPWLSIESNRVDLGPGSKKRFRFELSVPVDTQLSECRVALMVEGAEPSEMKDVPINVVGRIAVIIYARIGDAAPALTVSGADVENSQSGQFPVLSIQNTGNATGRLGGLLNGKDASGKSYAFAPSSFPILPGMTRNILLIPQADTPDAPAPTLVYPVSLEGNLEWGNSSTPLKATFTPKTND